MFFLDPAFHKKGYSVEILPFLVKNHSTCSVDVNKQNISATQFYRKNGFEVVREMQIDGLGSPLSDATYKAIVVIHSKKTEMILYNHLGFLMVGT
ncbi:GNAT family N-acetyltransferase [Candidatus Enterococcus clewellii]|uniref:GNAT family N-acetyltransferase n=1 Tax=Candidatus Enterococcus clewellii TaxID=1834193 RepID=UPI003BAF839F